MKSKLYVISILTLLFSGCESDFESESISIYAEKFVGKWRLSETLEVREFTEGGTAYVYNMEEGRGEQFQYFDADESQIRFYKDEDLTGESWNFPYKLDYNTTGTELLIITVIHPEGQGFLDCNYTRIE